MSARTERREIIDPYSALVLAALLSVSLAPMILLGALLLSAVLVGATSLFSLTLAVAELAAELDPRAAAPSGSRRRTASRVGRRQREEEEEARPRHRVTLTRPTV